MKLKLAKPETAAGLVSLAILLLVLMPRPIVGVADNGDFGRIMGSVGLSHLPASYDDRYFGYVNREYYIGFPVPFGGGYFSTEIFLAALAVFISRCLNSTGIFDIRYLALIYVMVFVTAISLIVLGVRKRWGWAGWLTAVASVFIFCDVAYISYFNSFYGEAVTLAFLLLAAGAFIVLAASGKPGLWALVLFFAAAAFFAGAKVQNSPAGLLAPLLAFRLIRLRRDKLWKNTVVISSVCVVAVSMLSYMTISRDIKTCNKYQTVFYGILKDSPDPGSDLLELGLKPEYKALAGTNYFMEEYPVDIRTPGFKEEIDNNINHFNIAGFYLRHPDRLLEKLQVAAFNGFKLKQGFGNYEKHPGVEFKATADIFSLWSGFKLDVLPHSLSFVCLFFAGFALALAYEYFRDIRNRESHNRPFIELLAFICLTGATQFVLPIIGDGEADLSKHLFLFNLCFDIMFAAAVIYSPYKLCGFLKAKFLKANFAGT